MFAEQDCVAPTSPSEKGEGVQDSRSEAAEVHPEL